MTFRPPPVPTLGQDPTFSAHRKGLEGQVLELSSLYRRSQLQVKEYKDQLRRAEVKIGGLEDGAAAAQSKLATLESIKEYSKDLQSRLAFAPRSAWSSEDACRSTPLFWFIFCCVPLTLERSFTGENCGGLSI